MANIFVQTASAQCSTVGITQTVVLEGLYPCITSKHSMPQPYLLTATTYTWVPVLPCSSSYSGSDDKLLTAAPRLYCWLYFMPSRHTVISSNSLKAFTTLMPTPCNPPDTLYPLPWPPNLPPACSTVSTVSSADLPVLGCMPVGIPLGKSKQRDVRCGMQKRMWGCFTPCICFLGY